MKNIIGNFQLIFAVENKKKSMTVSYVIGLILKNLSGPFSGPEPETFCTGKCLKKGAISVNERISVKIQNRPDRDFS